MGVSSQQPENPLWASILPEGSGEPVPVIVRPELEVLLEPVSGWVVQTMLLGRIVDNPGDGVLVTPAPIPVHDSALSPSRRW